MDQTQKDYRAYELVQKYNEKDLSKNLVDYYSFLDTLIYLHEALSEEEINVKYWQVLSETLLHKFMFHGMSMYNILSGFTMRSEYYAELSKRPIIDISSEKVIFRAQLETFLMYHYMYVNPDTDDLKILRYNAWIYTGLLLQQKLPANTEFAKEQKKRDLIQIEKIRSQILNTQSFNALSSNQQKSLIEKGNGKLFSHWNTILTETGFGNKNMFHSIYNQLSIYAHSEGMSAIQLKWQPGSLNNEISQANLDLHFSKILVCLMINSVKNLFEIVQKRFDTLTEIRRFDIEFYCRLADLKK